MGSYFDRYPTAPETAKLLGHCLLCGGYTAFRLHDSVLIQHAIPTSLVSQVDPNGERTWCKILYSLRFLFHDRMLLHRWSFLALQLVFIGSISHPIRTGLSFHL